MVLRYEDADNVRDIARGQSASYSPTKRNQRRESNRFVQGVRDFGSNTGQMAKDVNSIVGKNPITNTIQKGVDYGRDIFGKLPSMMAIDHVARNWEMSKQNRDYFGGNWLHGKIPEKVRKSVMSPGSQEKVDKFMKLAGYTDDPRQKQEYLDAANSYRRNADLTARINYGLSQIDPEGEYLNREGLPSYSQDLFGEGQPRFDMDRFKEAMGMGEGILGGLSPLDVHPDVLDNYVEETFGFDGDISREEQLQALVDAEQKRIDNFETTAYSDILDDAIENQWPTVQGQMDDPFADISARSAGLYGGSMTEEEKYLQERKRMDEYKKFYMNQGEMDNPFYPMPFDDSNREQGIMDQHYQSPISPILDIDTPSDGLSGRPNMMDISGRGINRGLIPYPGYNSDFVKILQQGRGELPIPGSENQPYNFDIMNRDFDYGQSNRDRQDSYRLDQLLERMRPEEVEEEEFQMFGPRGR